MRYFFLPAPTQRWGARLTGLASILLTLASATHAQTTTFTASGTYTIPAGATSIKVEAWGGGGGGSNTHQASGGGGGGAYATATFVAVPGATIPYTVGAGGTAGTAGGASTWNTAQVVAAGGAPGVGGTPTDGGQGGAGGACTPLTGAQSGGRGGDGVRTILSGGNFYYACGGGGGSATATAPGGAGGNGNLTPAANGGSGEGAGGKGYFLLSSDDSGLTEAPGTPGSPPGGGGGGGSTVSGTSSASAGARGQIRVTAIVPPPTRLYVNAASTTPGAGTTWATAFTRLGDALETARLQPSITEVWVAQGTYKPSRALDGSPAPDLRDAVFPVLAGVSLYGGFAGSETSLGQRVAGRTSTLSGDHNGDDVVTGSGATLSISGNAENANLVLQGFDLTAPALLDGLRVTGGHGRGGMFVSSSTVTVSNCVFSGNYAVDFGGGIRSDYGSLTLTRCVISRNLILAFNNNYGGAGVASISSGSTAVLRDCVLSGNRCDGGGNGGGLLTGDGSAQLTNCVLTNNYASSGGGAATLTNTQLGLTNCTVSRNEGNGSLYFAQGGGPGGPSGEGQIVNSILWDNTGGDLVNGDTNNGGGNITVGYSTVGDYVAGTTPITPTGPISTADPLFVNSADPDGADNIFATSDDGLTLQAASPAIDGGDPATTSPTTDLIGAARLGTFDQGAYERALPRNVTVSTPQTLAAGVYTSITVTATGRATLSGDVSVTQAVVVQSGGFFDTNQHLVTGPGSFTLQADAELTIGHQDGITASGPTGSVRVSGARSFSPQASYYYNMRFPSATFQDQYTGNGLPATVRRLTVNSYGCFDIGGEVGCDPYPLHLSQALRIERALHIEGSSLATDGQLLTLLSSAVSTAYVNDNGGGVNGVVTVQRYIGGPTVAGYRHLSSPVQAAPVSDLTTTGFTPKVNPAYNALPYVAPSAASFPNIFGFDETRGGTTPAYAGFSTGYFSPASLETTLTPGRGYSVLMPGAKTPDFVGSLTTGDVPMTLTVTGTNTSPNTLKAGWGLLGNPYAQPIDWDLATVPTGMSNSISVFRTQGGNNGQYLTRANGVGSLPNGELPLGQGFFARATSATTFTFTNALRVATNPGPVARPVVNTRPMIRLTLQATTPDAAADETLIYAQADATTGEDARFDGLRPGRNTGTVPTLASLIDGQEAAVNGLPLESLATGQTVVELTAALPTAGTYTLTAADVANLPAGTTVSLLDRQLNITQPLTVGTGYQLTASAAGEVLAGRFALVFTGANAPLSAGGLVVTPRALQVYPNPTSAQGAVQVAGAVVGTRLTLFDALGRSVAHATADTAGVTSLPTRGLVAGVYLLRAADGRTARLVVE